MAENDSSTELNVKQETLISLLLAGIHINAAAKQAGVSEKTAFRWLKLPHFQAAYKAAQASLFEQALTGLMLKVDKAIETLDRNMNGEEVPASVQVRSAQIVLEQAIAVHKMSELEAKISELEQAVKLQGRDR